MPPRGKKRAAASEETNVDQQTPQPQPLPPASGPSLMELVAQEQDKDAAAASSSSAASTESAAAAAPAPAPAPAAAAAPRSSARHSSAAEQAEDGEAAAESTADSATSGRSARSAAGRGRARGRGRSAQSVEQRLQEELPPVSFDASGRLAADVDAAFQSELAAYRDPAFIAARDAALAEARRGAPPQSQPQPVDSGLSFMDLVAQEMAKDSEHAQTGQKQCDNKPADEDEAMMQEAEEEPSAASSSSSTSASASANSRAPVLQLVDAYCAFIKAKWRHLAPSSSP